MFLLIPASAFLVLWAVLVRSGLGVRVAFLAAHVINGVLIVFATEALSAFQALTWWPLVSFWSTVLLINLAILYRLRGRPWPVWSFEPFDSMEKFILVATGLIVVLTGLIAWVAPPNSIDSMVYHMARVAHWLNNGTVANYPTNIMKQLVYPPFAEFAILQTCILSGADHFANIVQWNSMVSSLVGVSLITKLLGGTRRVQFVSVLFFVTLPMSILQSSSVQNDYVAVFSAVCIVVFALLLLMTGKFQWGIWGALSFGLAFFTKGIAVIVGAPFVVWALWKVPWKARHKIALVLLGILTALAINAPFLHRLTELSPSPYKAMTMAAHDVGDSAVVADAVDGRSLVSNAVCGLVTELATPFSAWNKMLLKGAEGVHHWLGLNMAYDPRFSSKFILYYRPAMELVATSFIHSWLYLLALLAAFIFAVHRCISGRIPRPRVSSPSQEDGDVNGKAAGASCRVLPFVVVLLVSALVFCALIKWQLNIARFHFPFFVLFSPVAAVIFSGLFPRSWLLWVVGGLMFVMAFYPLLYNRQRPILPCGGLERTAFESRVPHGGEVFRWLIKNGFIQEGPFGKWYIKDITDEMWMRLMFAYPDEFKMVWVVLREPFSFSRGIFSTPREEMLFFGTFGRISRDEIGRTIKFIKQQLSAAPGCRDIGYDSGYIQYEYPLWSVLNTDGQKVRIEHILVRNVSQKIPYPRGEPDPCLIVVEGQDGPETMEYKGRTYRLGTPGPWQVYVDERIKGEGLILPPRR